MRPLLRSGSESIPQHALKPGVLAPLFALLAQILISFVACQLKNTRLHFRSLLPVTVYRKRFGPTLQ